MYRLKVSSPDATILEQVRQFALSLGCEADMLLSRNDESTTQIVPTKSDFHELYAIARNREIGYIGVTKTGAAQRINTHLAKAEQANEPFVKWLAEGLLLRDINAGVIETANNKSDAYNREMELVAKMHPLFNKRGPTLLNRIGGLTKIELE
jgi:hypothetical protein